MTHTEMTGPVGTSALETGEGKQMPGLEREICMEVCGVNRPQASYALPRHPRAVH